MTTKDHIALLRTLARNWWLFWNKVWNNPIFFKDLEKISNMERLARINPKNQAPLVPARILEGLKLNVRNPSTAPLAIAQSIATAG